MLALTIANLGQRLDYWQAAHERLGKPFGPVLSYEDVLESDQQLVDAIQAIQQTAAEQGLKPYVRLESPGEDMATNNALIALGATERPDIAADVVQTTRPEFGAIYYPAQWYAGFVSMMSQLSQTLDATGIAVMNHPDDLCVLFDKVRTSINIAPKVAVPDMLAPVEAGSYVSLVDAMQARSWHQVFIKLSCGSSASGVMALRRASNGNVVAYTTMRLQDKGDGSMGLQGGEPPRIFNSLKIQRYTDELDIEFLVNYLFSQGAQVQRWLPKSQFEGQNYDFRVLTIGGQAQHCVVRLSKTPLTNLHLGNERADFEALGLAPDTMQRVLAAAEDAAACFPKSHYLGIDVMLTGRQQQAVVIECNGFGDLLPTARYDGHTTHEQELMCWQ